MRKGSLLPLVLACLLAASGVAFARDAAEVFDRVPDTLQQQLDALAAGPYTLISGYRDLDGEDERAVLLLETGGEMRLYIFKSEAGAWRPEVVSNPLPAVQGAAVSVEGWAGFFWLNYQYTDTDGRAVQISYEISLQWNTWRVNSFVIARDGIYAVQADFTTKHAPNMVVDSEYEWLHGLFDNQLSIVIFPLTARDVREATSMDSLAMVSNPDPKDRLNLRREPSKDAKSLGKYYNGTVALVLDDRTDGWVYVDIEGERGYFMREFLALDTEAASRVIMPEIFMKKLVSESPGVAAPMYVRPDTASSILMTVQVGDGVFVLGDIGEEWSHVMYGDMPGFVQTKYLTFGNG